MKHFRGLKKAKLIKDEDPEKIAEQKLALLSEEPFSQENPNSQRWAFPESQYKLLRESPKESNKENSTKAQSESSKITLKKNFFLRKDDSAVSSDLKKYCRIYCNLENIKSENLFPEKKSLSLTNYMLFDKRKSVISSEKNIMPKQDEKRIKLLRLKKIFLPKQQRKASFSSEKNMEKNETSSSYRVKINLRNFSPSENRKISVNESPKSNRNHQENQSLLEVSRVLSSIIKRKEVPNMSLQECHKSYFTAKKKLEDTKYIESSINSNKIKLHEHYEKFAI